MRTKEMRRTTLRMNNMFMHELLEVTIRTFKGGDAKIKGSKERKGKKKGDANPNKREARFFILGCLDV